MYKWENKVMISERKLEAIQFNVARKTAFPVFIVLFLTSYDERFLIIL